jgi:hypothetical protein
MGGVANLTYLILMEKLQGRTDRQTKKGVPLTVYANDASRHVLGRRDGSEELTGSKRVLDWREQRSQRWPRPRR